MRFYVIIAALFTFFQIGKDETKEERGDAVTDGPSRARIAAFRTALDFAKRPACLQL